MVLQTGACSKYLLSATSRLQRHTAQQGRKSNAMLGSMLVLRLQGRHDCQCGWPGMVLPMADHTSLEPAQSFDGCHRQGLLLVTARRGRQTTLCHGLAETDNSPRGSGSEDLGHGWGRDSGDTGEALSTLGKGPMLPSIEVHCQRHVAVGLKRRERDLTKPRPTVRERNGKTRGRDASFWMLFHLVQQGNPSTCIRDAALEPCNGCQKRAGIGHDSRG